jgi:PAS domain S-box-containing protein
MFGNYGVRAAWAADDVQMRREHTRRPGRHTTVSTAFALSGAAMLGAHALIDVPVVRATLYVLVGLVALGAVIVGTQARKGELSGAWRWIALGLAMWVAGDVCWSIDSLDGVVAYPSVADGLYVAGYPLFAAGPFALSLGFGTRRRLGAELIDATIVALCVGLLVWPFVFGPTLKLGLSASTAVTLAYSTGDLVLLALLTALCLNPAKRSRAVTLLTVALLAIFLADSLTYVAEFAPGLPSEFVTLLWLAGYVIVGAAALDRSATKCAVGRASTPLPRLVPVGAGLLAIPAAIGIGAVGDGIDEWAFVPIVTAVIVLLSFRGASLVREAHRSSVLAELARERLATVLETAGVGIVFRTSPLMTDSNKALQDMLGYDQEELAKLSYVDVIHPDEQVEARGIPIVPAGTKTELMRRFVRKDGSVLQAHVTLTATAAGLSVAVIEDVTERLSLERQLGEAQKLEAVGQLAGGIAHDFNNLLTAVTGHAELLRNSENSSDDEESIEAIQHAAAKAGDLTRQLVAFSRSHEFAPEPIDVPKMVTSAVDLLQRLLPRTISIEARIDAKAPAIFADPSQIDQVLMNLAVNARDAMPDGGLLQIAVASWTADGTGTSFPAAGLGEYCRVTVTDSGAGMDAATRARIFEPFFTTKDPGKGTGLGLSTIYGIVTRSGGHIDVESEPGVGTTFEIVLPACRAVVAVRDGELVAV